MSGTARKRGSESSSKEHAETSIMPASIVPTCASVCSVLRRSGTACLQTLVSLLSTAGRCLLLSLSFLFFSCSLFLSVTFISVFPTRFTRFSICDSFFLSFILVFESTVIQVKLPGQYWLCSGSSLLPCECAGTERRRTHDGEIIPMDHVVDSVCLHGNCLAV